MDEIFFIVVEQSNDMSDVQNVCKNMEKTEMKIEQMMPLAENMAVMVPIYGEDKNIDVFVDSRDTTDAYCLAVVSVKSQNFTHTSVLPFNMSDDIPDINPGAVVVNLPKCPNCGKYMKPHMKRGDLAEEAVFSCECGTAKSDPWYSAKKAEDDFWKQ